eukprot:356656-Chlamydomonas_euryale.AAC.7
MPAPAPMRTPTHKASPAFCPPHRQQVDLWVAGHDPEAIVLAAERLRAGALRHVPHAHALVLGVGHNQVLRGTKGGGGRERE